MTTMSATHVCCRDSIFGPLERSDSLDRQTIRFSATMDTSAGGSRCSACSQLRENAVGAVISCWDFSGPMSRSLALVIHSSSYFMQFARRSMETYSRE